MPTRNRPDFVRQAIRYFERQDYPVRELIILDDGIERSFVEAKDQRIRYFHLRKAMPIGAKRNYGCSLARGSIIAHWDDDDWYGPSRLSGQAAPLVAGLAEMSTFSECIFFDLARWIFWRCTTRVFKRMFVGGVHAGALMYRRSLFDKGIRYPGCSLAEDAFFLYQAHKRGSRVESLQSDGLFIYLRHPNNSWHFEVGRHIDPFGWERVKEPPLVAEDREFFQLRAKVYTASRFPEDLSPLGAGL